MNCLDFCRQLAVDPQNRESSFLQHRQACTHCAEAHARGLSFEQVLADAIAIPVPANLAERILFAHATEQRRQTRIHRVRWIQYATAAMLLLALGAGGYSRWNQPGLVDLAIAHLSGEPDALTSHTVVPDLLVQKEFAIRANILLQIVPLGVTYLHDCPVGRYHAVHMVMAQDNDPVTVLYIADYHHALRKDFDQAGWYGRAVPLDAGTLVLLGKHPRSFDHLETLWHDAVNGARLAAL